jgi:hypothetical protein
MQSTISNIVVPFTSDVSDVIARINKLKTGSGCSCKQRSGKGFRYV